MPCRSGSPQGVFNARAAACAAAESAGAWANVCVMKNEMTAAAIVTVISELEQLSHMMASFCSVLLQRIFPHQPNENERNGSALQHQPIARKREGS